MVLESHGDVVAHMTLRRGRSEAVEIGGFLRERNLKNKSREGGDEGDDDRGKITTLTHLMA